LFERARDAVQNYVEVDGGHRRGLQDGKEGGYLSLRVYPKGKAKSDEHYTAETWFRFSSPQDKETLSYDFMFSLPHRNTVRPEDYI
jgi:hypothetical protein